MVNKIEVLGPEIKIRGQVKYTGSLASRAYRLNSLICSFTNAANREAFKQNEYAYANRYGLSTKEFELIKNRDLLGMYLYGVNIYAVAKACVSLGGSLADLGKAMRSLPLDINYPDEGGL